MAPSDSPEPSDSLEPMLARWGQGGPRLPGSVAPEVWRRIAEGERRRAAPGWGERVHAAFARPSFATAFCAACMLLGLFLAELRSSRLRTEDNARVAQNYLRTIDPLFAESAPPAPRP